MLLSFYRYDARNKGKPTLWSEDEPKGFGNRAHFKAQSPNAMLYLDNITFNEGGIFRCRVDFQTAQTRNSLFNLTVIGMKYNCLQLNLACYYDLFGECMQCPFQLTLN